MKKQSFINVGILLSICLAFFSSCAKYDAKPLNRLATSASINDKEQSSIKFAYRVFDRHDCKKYLDRDVIAKGYQPIHITLTNNSNRCLNVSTKNFSLPCVMPNEIAKKVHTSTTKRVAGYGVAGLFCWPLLVPAVVDGISSSKANKHLDSDFAQKTLQDQLVNPFCTINGIIFVPAEDFNPEFAFTIIDSENHDRFVLTSTKTTLKI